MLNASFEGAQVEASSFDLVFAAQSFHWVAPEVAFTKTAELLKLQGWFAAFWKRWLPTGAEAESKETKLYQEYFSDYAPVTPQQHEEDALGDLAGSWVLSFLLDADCGDTLRRKSRMLVLRSNEPKVSELGRK